MLAGATVGMNASRSGWPPSATAAFRLAMSRSTASGRDLGQGRRVEVETILGDLITEGRKANLHTPLLDAATAALRVYAARLP
jgi:ketopantoate reductase